MNTQFPQPTQQKTIFVVDDSLTNLAISEEVLEPYYIVITLTSAAKMFAVIEKITPDLILLDIDMPDMDGFETLKLLKKDKRYSHIPVVFLTGLTDSETEAYVIELGAADLVRKPFSQPVLLNRIKTHLQIDSHIHEQMKKLEQLNNALSYTLDSVRFILKEKHEEIDSQTNDILSKVKHKLDSVLASVKK